MKLEVFGSMTDVDEKEITIRPMQEEDFDDCASLEYEIMQRKDFFDTISKIGEKKTSNHVLLSGDSIMGFTVSTIEPPHAKGFILVVHPSLQNSGYSKKIMEIVFKEAAENGCTSALCTISPRNEVGFTVASQINAIPRAPIDPDDPNSYFVFEKILKEYL